MPLSCAKDVFPDENPRDAEVVVTVKQDTDGTVYFQLNDDERLYPLNGYEFTRQERILASLTVFAEEVPLYGHTVLVNWAEPLEQGTVYSEDINISGYDDSIDVLPDWVTSVEDGYLTVHYSTWWGDPSGHHDIILVTGPGPDELTLLHSSQGDDKENYSDGIIYFDINKYIEPTDTYKPIKLHWTGTNGSESTRIFEFKTRK